MFEKILKIGIVVLAIVFFGYVFRNTISLDYNYLYNTYLPCQKPITYSMGTFDTRFGISKEDFLKDIEIAKSIWEKPIGKKLFTYSEKGELSVNLVYDMRQADTVKIQQLGTASQNDRATYDKTHAEYVSLQKQYIAEKALYDSALATYSKHQDAYNTEVNSSNAQGGADKETFAKLSAEKATLLTEFQNLKSIESKNNQLVGEINTIVSKLNTQAKALNLNVAQINTLAGANGEDFTEGLYHRGPDGEEIDVYQYENEDKLIRVLAHEFGHALGLEHTNNPKDIMYALNEGSNDVLTTNDLNALKGHCNIK